MRTNHSVAVGIATMALWTAAGSGLAHTTGSREETLERFHAAVSTYMSLREAVELTVPPLEMSPDWESIHAGIDARADAIRAARPSAKEGDIFDAAATTLLHGRIRQALGTPGCGVEDILAAQRNDGRLATALRPLVHDRFDWAAGSFMPYCILTVLPALPGELEYRFVGRDLTLVDTTADLVVDVLPDALPAGESWTGVRYARGGDQDCDVPLRNIWRATANS